MSRESNSESSAWLRAHAADCEDCRTQALPLERLGEVLTSASSHVDLDAPSLSQRTLAFLSPELARRAAAAFRRRVALGVLLSLPPLAAVLALDAYFLGAVYAVVTMLLPRTFAAYLVLSYGAFVVLLFALTYAAIPILVARGEARPAAAVG